MSLGAYRRFGGAASQSSAPAWQQFMRQAGGSRSGSDPDSEQARLDRAASGYQSRQAESLAFGREDDGQAAPGIVEAALGVIDAPRSLLFNFGRELFEQGGPDLGRAMDRHRERESFRDLEGLGRDEDRAWFAPSNLARSAGSFVGDVVLDPLTYFTFGGAAVGKRAATEMVEAGSRSWASRNLSDDAVERFARRSAPDRTEQFLRRTSGDEAADTFRANNRLQRRPGMSDDEWVQAESAWRKQLGRDEFGAEAASAYVQGGSTGLRRWMRNELGGDLGEQAFTALPRDVQGGGVFRMPFVRTGVEGGRAPVSVGVGGGGRILERAGLDRLALAGTTARNRLRASKAGQAMSRAIGGRDGALYGAVVRDIANNHASEVGGHTYAMYAAVRRARVEAGNLAVRMQDETVETVAAMDRWMQELPDAERAAAVARRDELFQNPRMLDEYLGANVEGVDSLAGTANAASQQAFDALPQAERHAVAAASLGHAYLRRTHDMLRDAGVSIGEIREYVPMMLTEEARQARRLATAGSRGRSGRGGGGHDPTREARHFWVPEVADDGSVSGWRRMSPEQANMSHSERVAAQTATLDTDEYVTSPLEMIERYGSAARRMASNVRAANLLRDAGVLTVGGTDSVRHVVSQRLAAGQQTLSASADDLSASGTRGTRLYHGTSRSPFSRFDVDEANPRSGMDRFYFAEDPKMALRFANSNTSGTYSSSVKDTRQHLTDSGLMSSEASSADFITALRRWADSAVGEDAHIEVIAPDGTYSAKPMREVSAEDISTLDDITIFEGRPRVLELDTHGSIVDLTDPDSIPADVRAALSEDRHMRGYLEAISEPGTGSGWRAHEFSAGLSDILRRFGYSGARVVDAGAPGEGVGRSVTMLADQIPAPREVGDPLSRAIDEAFVRRDTLEQTFARLATEQPDVQLRQIGDLMDGMVEFHARALDALRSVPDTSKEWRSRIADAKTRLREARQIAAGAVSQTTIADAGTQSLQREGLSRLGQSVPGGRRAVDAVLPPEVDQTYAPDVMAEAVEKLFRVSRQADPDLGKFVDNVYRPYFNFFKTTATVGRGYGYDARNVMGGIWNNWIAGVTADDHQMSARLVMAKREGHRRAVADMASEMAESRGVTEREARRLLDGTEIENRIEQHLADTLADVTVADGVSLYDVHRMMEDNQVSMFNRLQEGLGDAVQSGNVSAFTRGEAPINLFGGVDPDSLNRVQRGLNSFMSDGPTGSWFRHKGRVAETSESYIRGAAFIRGAREYGTADGGQSAGLLAKGLHFDYDDLSDFEQTWLRGFAVPFWTWTKNNVPLQFRALVKNPGLMNRAGHFHGAVEQTIGSDEDGIVPEWMRGRFGFVSDIDLGPLSGGNPLVVGMENSAVDLNRWLRVGRPGEIAEGVSRELVNSLSPAISVPIEAGLGINMFTGASHRADGAEAPGWYRALGLDRLPGMGWEGDEGERRAPEALIGAVENTLPPVGLLERHIGGALGLAGVGNQERSAERLGTTLLSNWAAMPVSTLSPRQETAELLSRDRRISRRLTRADVSPAERERVQELLSAGWPPEMVAAMLERSRA